MDDADARAKTTAPPPAERGSLSIADRVLERIASIAAGETESVTHRSAGWRRAVGLELPRAHAKVAGDQARLSVQVSSTWPQPLAATASRVRDHVHERVTTLTGVTVTAVDVTIADVLAPRDTSRRVE